MCPLKPQNRLLCVVKERETKKRYFRIPGTQKNTEETQTNPKKHHVSESFELRVNHGHYEQPQ